LKKNGKRPREQMVRKISLGVIFEAESKKQSKYYAKISVLVVQKTSWNKKHAHWP